MPVSSDRLSHIDSALDNAGGHLLVHAHGSAMCISICTDHWLVVLTAYTVIRVRESWPTRILGSTRLGLAHLATHPHRRCMWL